jgi:AcrR family transcriptional regulator
MPQGEETLRQRRRRETSRHIAETGLRLFEQQGYDQTTMQAVAEASGVAPRTLFHYFETKDRILRYWLAGEFAGELRSAMLEQPANSAPLVAARTALRELVAQHETPESLAVDRVLNSTPALRASKQATFIDWEDALNEALAERYGTQFDAEQLQAVAMLSIGALRLALERRRGEPESSVPLDRQLAAVFEQVSSAVGRLT